MKCIISLSQVMPLEPGCIAAIITREIGPPSLIEEATVSNPLQEDDSNQAIDRTAAGSRCGKLFDPMQSAACQK